MSVVLAGALGVSEPVSRGKNKTPIIQISWTNTPEPITTLFNTGVDEVGAVLADDAVDPHWTLTASDDPTWDGPATYAASLIPSTVWLANDSTSRWIAPSFEFTNVETGIYIYQTVFNLVGFIPDTAQITGRFSADCGAPRILLNGVETGQGQTGLGFFSSWHDFVITNGFLPGANTLEFTVENGDVTVPNPSGLRVEITSATALVDPGTDSDSDGVTDSNDNCPDGFNPFQEDIDGDGLGDVCDNCPSLHNPGQEDSNGNGIGNACEPAGICDSATTPSEFVRKGATGQSNRILVTNLSYPNGDKSFFDPNNPQISGDNLYAPDFVRVGDVWYVYHGGWLISDQLHDRIYLATTDDLDPSGYVSPSQLLVTNGEYLHVNDPSVVFHDGTWYMVYTAAKFVGERYRDWINYSTSNDGVNWTPDSGSSATEITLTDPDGLIPGGGVNNIDRIARPSLGRTADGRWKMWFDLKQFDAGYLQSYLAESTESGTPTTFSVAKRYDDINGWPGLLEPDIEERNDGTYVGVIQEHFARLYIVKSSDGFDFTRSAAPTMAESDPSFTRGYISNPGLMYDRNTDQVYGVGFGMTDSPILLDHDIGFSYMQYKIEIDSPGGVTHGVVVVGDSLAQQAVYVFDFTEFETIRLLDPVTGKILLSQDFSTAKVGDLWELRCDEVTVDGDGDGIDDAWDACPNTIPGVTVDECGCPPVGLGDDDRDGDLDLGDFDVFAACLAGPDDDGLLLGCSQVQFDLMDFDDDIDVDLSDFRLFQECLSGENNPEKPGCGSFDEGCK